MALGPRRGKLLQRTHFFLEPELSVTALRLLPFNIARHRVCLHDLDRILKNCGGSG
jgi:hypothetical protein